MAILGHKSGRVTGFFDLAAGGGEDAVEQVAEKVGRCLTRACTLAHSVEASDSRDDVDDLEGVVVGHGGADATQSEVVAQSERFFDSVVRAVTGIVGAH